MKFQSVILIFCLTFLSSCGTTLFKRLDVNTVEEKRPDYVTVQPEPLKMEEVKFFVITPKNVDEVFKQLDEQGLEPIIIGTSIQGYTMILTDNVKIQQLLQKYQTDIIEMQKYYTTK